ncbi:hypothetical protein [Acidaminococcus timonensis]|uniref:hypothetical protein n=1 Tax=Acidaminococcus timonensis TaxID=1871002 RepID=UPI0008D93EC8|nr:hypothetical protein [Acidaminococcus timonensis]
MTRILFNLVLLAMAMDLIIWGIDQGWSLVNRYRDHKGNEITYDHILKAWLKLQQTEPTKQHPEINKWGQKKPKTNVVPLWHRKPGGGDSDGHA